MILILPAMIVLIYFITRLAKDLWRIYKDDYTEDFESKNFYDDN